jgi:uncharacterized OB-fold protein
MSDNRTAIVETILTHPFWQATRERRFLLQFDSQANRYQFYPRPISLYSTMPLVWREARGEGTLVAHTLCHTPAPGFKALTPYILGLVKLAEGPRVFARVVDTTYDDLRIGQPMRLAWGEEFGDGREYLFVPADKPVSHGIT